MKIVVFGNCARLGGAQTAFRRLSEFFLTEGHRIGLIGIAETDADLPFRNEISFGVHITERQQSCGRKVAQICRAAILARRHNPEIFIAVGLAKSANLIARLLPSRTFKVCQDFIYGRKLSDPLLRATRRSFNALAVQSPSMVTALCAQGFTGTPVAWLPCFPARRHVVFRRHNKTNMQTVHLAYMGRLAWNKGLDLLLQALAHRKFSKPVFLDIWGEGAELKTLREIVVKTDLLGTVRFCGRYPEGEEFGQLISSYDGLVLPSTGVEGLPLILLEAMAYGVPFLATKVGAIPDCCVDNQDVILAEPTTNTLRAGLERFVNELASGHFSTERLIRYYESRFSFDVMADRWRKMIAEPQSFFSNNE